MRRRLLVPAALAVALGLAACEGDVPAPPDPTTSGADEESGLYAGPELAAEDLRAASNALGPVLLAADSNLVNAVVSPASLTLALATLGAGASNEAAAQFDEVLGSHGAPLLEAAEALRAGQDHYEGEPVVDPDEPPAVPLMHIADHLVVDDEAQIEQRYLDLTQQVGGAEISPTDFGDSAASKSLLDEWVNLHTGGLIPQSAIIPTPDMRLVIQNAVLFSARWESEFDQSRTFEDTFYLLDGSTVSTELMHGTLYVPLAEVDGWSAIELPYTEGFATIVILPPRGSDPLAEGPEAVAGRIEGLRTALAGESDEATVVTLPVLELASQLDLKEALTAAGLGAMFDGDGEPFRGISTAETLFVSQAAQQGVMIVNEAGTTAAAVTEFGMEATAAPDPEEPRVFTVDRPFLLTITSQADGWDLFQAVVRNPTVG